ncbi:MAG: hypothetical protein RIK87_08435 [Fuerstiella sp.]
MNRLSELAVRRCNPSRAASDAPFLVVHPEIVEALKRDGLPVEVVKEVNINIRPMDQENADAAPPIRFENFVKIRVAPLLPAYRKLVGDVRYNRQAEAAKLSAKEQSSNVQSETAKPASRADK